MGQPQRTGSLIATAWLLSGCGASAPASPPSAAGAVSARCVETGIPEAEALLTQGELIGAQRALDATETGRCETSQARATELRATLSGQLQLTDSAGVDLLERGMALLDTDPPRARTLLDRALVTLERESGAQALLQVKRGEDVPDDSWLSDGRHALTANPSFDRFLV